MGEYICRTHLIRVGIQNNKESSKFNNKKIHNPIKKNSPKNLTIQFTKENKRMASKQMKSCSTSLVIRK